MSSNSVVREAGDHSPGKRVARAGDPVVLAETVAVVVPVTSLLPGDSPRLAGEDPEHVAILAGVRDLPPIIVHLSSMRVIDGMHRLQAAMLRGDKTISVRFFEGDDKEAFLLSVNANMKHGLPLSLADREAAAGRILATYGHWSDRAIAVATGLSPTTVSTIRQRSQVPMAESGRVGRDGRVRPVDGSAGRRRASEVIANNPGASLRAIAREAGVSVGTARDVRERLRAGRDPVLPSGRGTAAEGTPSAGAALPRRRARKGSAPRGGPQGDWQSVRGGLRSDPAVWYGENGCALVRWVDDHVVEPVEPVEWRGLVDAVPSHWRDSVAEVARSCAEAWLEFARQLEQSKHTPPG